MWSDSPPEYHQTFLEKRAAQNKEAHFGVSSRWVGEVRGRGGREISCLHSHAKTHTDANATAQACVNTHAYTHPHSLCTDTLQLHYLISE